MDSLKARLFIKNLIYDLNTVQYLLDYGRLKETLPILEKILDNIDLFRTSNSGKGFNLIFAEEFWNDKLPGKMSYSEMRAQISKYSHALTSQIDQELEKIEYQGFVKDLFNWSEENISKIIHESRSPFQKKLKKFLIYALLMIVGLAVLAHFAYGFYAKDWGLKGDFYQGQNFDKYLYSNSKKTIDFSTSGDMYTSIPNDHFSTRWHGYLMAPHDGVYKLFVKSDDGDRLFIDDKLLVDLWAGNGGHEGNNNIFLSKGRHKIVLEYLQDWGEAYLMLYWNKDGGVSKEVIPSWFLRQD